MLVSKLPGPVRYTSSLQPIILMFYAQCLFRTQYLILVWVLCACFNTHPRDHLHIYVQVMRDGRDNMGLVDFAYEDDLLKALDVLDRSEFKNPFDRCESVARACSACQLSAQVMTHCVRSSRCIQAVTWFSSHQQQ